MLTVNGKSAGGSYTGLTVPKLGLALDIGYCSEEAIGDCGILLISHHHDDHVREIYDHVRGRMCEGLPPSRIVCGSKTATVLRKILNEHEVLGREPLEYQIHELTPGSSVFLDGLSFEAFETLHCKDALGYIVRHAGEVVLSFSGDARPEALDAVEAFWRAPTVILEMTYGREIPGPHLHLGNIVERVRKFECEHVYLYHLKSATPIYKVVNTLDRTVLKGRYTLIEG